MNTEFTKHVCLLPNGKYLSRLRFLSLLLLASLFTNNSLLAQCPTTSCATRTSLIKIGSLPECSVGTFETNGDISNNSDCESNSGLNCWKFVIDQDNDFQTSGITFDIGKGNGCNGQVDSFYTEIDGVCGAQNSSGSQNDFTFSFGNDGLITVWLCDNSSGQVSICDLCAEPLIPAPVELTSFDATKKENRVNLLWETSSETNNSGFEIERSLNGEDWRSIGFEASAFGTTTEKQNYTFTDFQPMTGYNYYRLKQVDFDGKFEYSEVIVTSFDFQEASNLQVFPNPSDGNFTLSLQNQESKKAFIKLFDSTGRMIWEQHFNKDNAQVLWQKYFDLPQHEVYFVVTQIGTYTETQKIVVIDNK